MNKLHFRAMTDEGLARCIEALSVEEGRVSLYESFKHTPQGLFLIEELKTRIENARSLYGYIDATSETAGYALATIQESERECRELLDRIMKTEVARDGITGRLSELRSLMKARSEQKKKRHYLPTNWKEGEDG